MFSTRDSLQIERHTQTKSEGMEKIFYVSSNFLKAGVVILISEKIDFKTKAINKRQRRTQQFHFWLFIQRNPHTNLKRHVHAYVHSNIIYNSQDMEAN